MGAIKIKPGKVLTFGEILLRITPDADGQWITDNRLPFYIAGAELNVATALALWGIDTKYFTAMPGNGMTDQLLKHLGQKNIDTSGISKSGDRLGLFYLTKGRDMKHDDLIYDRAGSSFASLKPGMVNWDTVLEGVSWFHFSAISPALSQQTADFCLEALEAASKKGITISVDLNYRAKLWQYGKSSKDIMPALVEHCDVVMGNVWAAEMMLDMPVRPDIHESGQKSIYLKEAQHTSQAIMRRFPKCKAVANTFRFGSNKSFNYYSALYTEEHLYHSADYNSESIVDKVGSGDCFMAGLIYGYCKGFDNAAILDFATAAAYTKLFVPSDATTVTMQEITKAIKYAN